MKKPHPARIVGTLQTFTLVTHLLIWIISIYSVRITGFKPSLISATGFVPPSSSSSSSSSSTLSTSSSSQNHHSKSMNRITNNLFTKSLSRRRSHLYFISTSTQSHNPYSSHFNNNNSNNNHNKNINSLFSSSSSSNDKTTSATTSASATTTSTNNNYTPPDPKRLSELMPEQNPETGHIYTTYEKCVRRLYLTNLFHPVKLGLQNMEQLHKALDEPINNKDKVVKLIHVAGTNGKGSVALKIAKVFELAGYNVGLFVSPHVSSFRERMQINSIPISEKEVEELLPMIYNICEEEEIPATFFEVTTALAFAFFDKRKADVVVLETGLGGRLDATNVVTNPDLCVITSIGLEHTRILGDTVELIAKEKAGIMKEGTPVLVGPDLPHDVMKQCAIEKKTEGYYTCEDALGGDDVKEYAEEVVVNGVKYVDYDIQNAMIAKAAIQILENKNKDNSSRIKFPFDVNTIEAGVKHRPPCRFEKMTIQLNESSNPVLVILDVAHNPPAMKHLVLKLEATYPEREKRIVVGFSADKDLAQCGNSLLSIVKDPSRLHLVEAAHPRAAKLEDMLIAEPKLRESNFDENDRSITAQVKSALSIAEKNNEILVVCGSVFLMAEAREAIGIDEPRDSEYIAEVAGANLRHGQEFFANSDPEKENN